VSDELTGDVVHDLPILMLAVCRLADAYTDCTAEFDDDLAACSEVYDHLVTAVNRWKGAQTVVDMRQRRGT
jgi:hypothetical protein